MKPYIAMIAQSWWGILFLVLAVVRVSILPGQGQVVVSPQTAGDFVIWGGEIIDGTGNASYKADILIKDDKITFIGQIDTNKVNATVIHADGKIVAPGFIDPHAHGNALSDNFENFLAMGVTTVLLGQDGASPVNQSSFGDAKAYFDNLEGKPKLINLSFLCGHGTMRSRLGLADRKRLSEEEMESLKALTSSSMEAGCYGLSTGLEYLPGSLADERELTAIAKVVGRFDGIMMSHMRSEDDSLMNISLQELKQLSRFCRAHVSHIKVVYGKSPERGMEILEQLRTSHQAERNLTADVYPYMASYTGIGIVFPSWAKTRKAFESAKLHKRKELEQYLHDKIMARNGPRATLFASRPFVGKTLEEVSKESGKDFVDILMSIGPQGASGAYFVMDESLQEVFITDPKIAIGSDGGPHLRHPRSYGSFAKVIRKYVVAEEKLALTTAIHKMSGLTASIIGLSKRGTIKKDNHADLLIFDPQKFIDHSSFTNPYSLSTGIEWIFINGQLVRKNEKVINPNCGVLLKKEY